jgi:SOS response regulatory protein OraA/RecX
MSSLEKINSKQYLEDVIVQILANCPEQYLLDDAKYCSEVAKIAEE